MNLRTALDIVAECGPASPHNTQQMDRDKKIKGWHMLKLYLTDQEKHDLKAQFAKVRTEGRTDYNGTISAIDARLVSEGYL